MEAPWLGPPWVGAQFASSKISIKSSTPQWPDSEIVRKQSTSRFKKCRIQNRPEVNEPTEQDKPEDSSQTKLDNGHEQSALKQLPQSRDEKTTECCDDISGRTLARHTHWILKAGISADKGKMRSRSVMGA